MEHPLIGNIDSMTIDQLQNKISELNKKLSIAHRSGNSHLTNQIRMALETFNNKYREKIADTYSKKSKDDPDFSDKIDIS
jgi:hypothetical protein